MDPFFFQWINHSARMRVKTTYNYYSMTTALNVSIEFLTDILGRFDDAYSFHRFEMRGTTKSPRPRTCWVLMGLAFDPNRTVPIKKSSLLGPDKPTKAPTGIVTKPYVLNQLQKEANVPERDCKTLSSDLIEYAQYMIREHNDDFKAMAQDEKNYYQDTPKQIKRKINEYMRCHPDAFMDSLAAP
uniref:Nucleolar protein 16 n=1 Tax=Gasterosteus aculeatus aculeatus TaxID=481459 RepID=G3QCA9_GASAC